MPHDFIPDDRDTCGCCDPAGDEAPARYNPPGLSAFAYRYGEYGNFLRWMFERLSRYEIPDGDYQGKRPLLDLTTRELNDPAIALLDGWAVVADVLTFYQERIANEGFLRTATERRSILELARSIGYELNPGVAASTYLAFDLKDNDTAPDYVTIGAGTQVKSIPPEGELPQTFETSAELIARPEWNTIKPVLLGDQPLSTVQTSLYVDGTNHNLRAGDALLFEASDITGANMLRFVVSTETDGDRTRIVWNKSVNLSASSGFLVWHLRTRASRFGHNAPAFTSLPEDTRKAILNKTTLTASDTEYPDFNSEDGGSNSNLDLDADYTEVQQGPLVMRAGANYRRLWVSAVESRSRAAFSLSGKHTRVTLTAATSDGLPTISTFPRRDTTIYTHGKALITAQVPRHDPIYGNLIETQALEHLPLKDQAIVITGLRARVRLDDMPWQLPDGSTILTDPSTHYLTETAPILTDTGQLTLFISDDDGLFGEATVDSWDDMDFVPPRETDKPISEVVFIKSATGTLETALFELTASTRYIYDRQSVTLTANVTHATHGETIAGEVLGHGDGAQTNQRFTLKKPPLTHISAKTPTGAETTLQVRVNRVLWHEAESLYPLSADDRAYITRMDNEGNTSVIFGDGQRGRRLPTGIENVTATYRQGIGLAGNVAQNSLAMLKTRPLGVRGVTNPLAASGGDDPEKLDDARDNAPLTVRTLDRVVSIYDYEDFAAAFAGIGKVQAVQLWDGQALRIVVTVASATGATLAATDDVWKNLYDAIDKANDPMHSFSLATFEPLLFNVTIGVIKHPDYLWDDVQDAATSALLSAFAFESRRFGQRVTTAEIITVIHGVAGVIAVDVDELYIKGDAPDINDVLPAQPARLDPADTTAPYTILKAQLLLINPAGITLTEKTV